MNDLPSSLATLSRASVLLVACDYDGTLAPIVDDPVRAQPDRETLVALRMLAAMPHTHVAVISGRALADLAARTGEGELHLVGSHGSEFDETLAARLPPAARELRESLATELRGIAGRSSHFYVEEKPAAFAFHYRRADEQSAAAALAEIMAGPATWPGVHVRHGKKVVELSVLETNKGAALQNLRRLVGAAAVLYLGDDLTDEDAFATLAGPDVGVKIGEGPTRAPYRLANTREVARLLAELADERAAWLAGGDATPIENHSLLSDQRTVALVNPRGRVVWLPLPRIDSSAVFAELVGGPAAGFFEVSVAGEHRPRTQNYEGDTLILKSSWERVTVTDYLDCSGGRAFRRAGRSDLVRVVEGRGPLRIVFAPRLDFGRIPTRLRVCEGGLEVEGGRDPLVLSAPALAWRIADEGPHQTASVEMVLDGAPLVLELRYGTGNLAPAVSPEPVRRRQTEQHWSSWVRSLNLPATARDLVARSALVLRALSHGPTGAVAAAATTSLPECLGGVRNWDYRYCWPRDAAMAAAALVRLGNTGVAMQFLDWILGVVDRCESPGRLCPVYTVSGGHLAPEAEISELPGYAGSRPVRIGNAASQQVQLDVFGPVADLVALLAERGCPLSPEHWRLCDLMVEAVADRWREPDHGIWEPRRPPRHHVHSKTMCWQTVDRALAVAAYLGRRRDGWDDLRRTIAEDVLSRGFRAEMNAFSGFYDEVQADSAALWVGLSGLLPAADPRYTGTLEWISRELREGRVLFRYRYDDGLPGREGGFNLCTTWLIEALHMTGRRDEAVHLFEEYTKLAGSTGLLSEEWDPATGRALGNVPQAYSHLGLINAAVRLNG